MINASPTPNEKLPNIATFSFWFSDQLAQLLHTSAVITIIQSLGLLFLCGLMLITWQEEDVFIWKSLKYNFRKSGGLQKRGEEANIPDLQHRTGGTKKEGVRYLFTRQRLLGGQVFSNEWNNQWNALQHNTKYWPLRPHFQICRLVTGMQITAQTLRDRQRSPYFC